MVLVEKYPNGKLMTVCYLLRFCYSQKLNFERDFIFQFNFRGRKLHRKELYTTLSLVFASFLFGVLVNDFVSIIEVEMPENSSHEFTFSILVSGACDMRTLL